MQKNSTGLRRSTSNPVRVSMLEREEKTAGRSDPRRTQMLKSKAPSQVDSSHIPRPKLRSSSSERTSIRRSNLKPPGKTPLRQQHVTGQPMRISNAATPLHNGTTPRASSGRAYLDLPSGPRHRSPSAERASGFGGKGPRKDNRQLNDKAYQAHMLGKIDQYFYEIQQTSLLNNNGSLKPITMKIFVEATNCLVKLLDIKQDLTIANYMDELPKVAKKLRYPGIVTKSWLKTANTMHSWPHVLGWLSWLCEVCEAKDKAELAFSIDKIPFLGNHDEEETQKCTFVAMLKIYKAWNEEKLEEEAALVEKRVAEMNEQYGDIDGAIEEEQLLLDKEKMSINIGDQQEAEINEEVNGLKAILESLKRDESRETEEINFTEGCVKRLMLEMKQLNVQCNTLEEQIEKDRLQQNELLTIVENQKMSVEKRDEIMKKCSEIQNYIQQFENHIKDIENERYALDLKFTKSNQNLYRAILAYNKDIIMHLGCDTGAEDLEALKMPETNLLSPDFIDILKTKEAAVLSLKETIRIQYVQTNTEIDANSNELDSLRDKLKTLREENKDYVAKAHEQKLCIQQIQHQAKDAEGKLKTQIKQLQNDIRHLQCSTPDVEAAANELAEAQDKFQAVVRRSEYVEKRMERFFDRFYEILACHRNDIHAVLLKLPGS